MDLFNADVAIPTEDGYWVSEAHERIAQIIKDYEPTLELAFIPPAKREPGDVPFAVIHRPLGKPAYIVFTADVCDERILERLWASDAAKQGNILSDLDAKNAAVKAIELRKKMDKAEEQRELVQSIVRSPKSVYKHDGVTYR